MSANCARRPGSLQGPGLSRFTPNSAPVADFCSAPLAGNYAAIDKALATAFTPEGLVAEINALTQDDHLDVRVCNALGRLVGVLRDTVGQAEEHLAICKNDVAVKADRLGVLERMLKVHYRRFQAAHSGTSSMEDAVRLGFPARREPDEFSELQEPPSGAVIYRTILQVSMANGWRVPFGHKEMEQSGWYRRAQCRQGWKSGATISHRE